MKERKFIGEIVPNLRPSFLNEVSLFGEHWKDSNLSITDAILLSVVEDLIYEFNGSLVSTRTSICECFSSFAGISTKTVDRFICKMLSLGYIINVKDKYANDNGYFRFTCRKIADDMDDYLANCGYSHLDNWMLQYIKNEQTKKLL